MEKKINMFYSHMIELYIPHSKLVVPKTNDSLMRKSDNGQSYNHYKTFYNLQLNF